MKKLLVFLTFLAILASAVSSANAVSVQLYLDTAPNVYGSPDWPAFRDNAYASIYNGSFVNQAHSLNPANHGTLNYAAEDYMVYSFGDLGKRLHSFYYIPDETIALLDSRFQVSILYEYDGVWYNPYEQYGWGEWITPSSWINYDGNNDGIIDGVMGSMGNALWGAYGYTSDTPEARSVLAADLQQARDYLGDTRFFARLDGQIFELRAHHTGAPVPEPSTILLLGAGLASLMGYGRLRQRGEKGQPDSTCCQG